MLSDQTVRYFEYPAIYDLEVHGNWFYWMLSHTDEDIWKEPVLYLKQNSIIKPPYTIF